jgi:hypothetical protein
LEPLQRIERQKADEAEGEHRERIGPPCAKPMVVMLEIFRWPEPGARFRTFPNEEARRGDRRRRAARRRGR